VLESVEWLQHAQLLHEGGSRKIPHDCGEGDCLHINHKQDGWSAYCHRCGYKRFIPRPAESVSEKLGRLRRIQAAEASVARNPSAPMPAEYEPHLWPLAARVWLYKAGLSNVEIQALGFYWNPRMQRVVMPVRNEAGEVIYWQARTLDRTNPKKYLNPHVDKSRLVARYGSGPAVVLTEDLLSAYRISRAGFEGWCLLGTKLNDHIAAELLRDGRPVVVWLDPDGAGQKGASQIIKRLRAYGVSVRNVVSDKDPKLLSREEIKCRLAK
jgi:hypothetical protein